MAKIPFKAPRESIRQALKTLKNEPHKKHPIYENQLWILADLRHQVIPEVKTYLGEIYHQLALRAQIRHDHTMTLRFYEQSIDVFRSREEPLGLARVLRDKALYVARFHDKREGLTLALEALNLHERDFDNAKGRRQELITKTYVWRINAMLDSRYDLSDLITTALDTDLGINARDQKEILEFLVSRVDASTRVRIKAQLALINAKQLRQIEVARSLTAMMVDIPIIVADRTFRLIFQKE